MLLFKKVNNLQNHLESKKSIGSSVGFVPTMGALHKGHLSLINASKESCDTTVCSIFVNPSQFNEASDLKKYPRTPGQDIDLLTSEKCDVLFMPPVEEIYPDPEAPAPSFDFGYLDQPMEGAHRPGHFKGMAQVVNRLLDIVIPDKLFMGQKDFQQFSIVQRMLELLQSHVELVLCPIIREADGLAMSSRNRRLTSAQREIAPNIHRTLKAAKGMVHSQLPNEIEKEALEMLNTAGMESEYFSIVDGYTLRPIEVFEDTNFAVACTAVRVGEIRLIDNMILKKAG